MQVPIIGSQLQKCFCAINSVHMRILEFSSIILLLQDFLVRTYRHVEKRTKKAISRFSVVKSGWSQQEKMLS